MPFVLESTSVSVANTATWLLPCLFVVSDPIQASARIRARLYVNNVEKPIRRATWSEDGQRGNLTVELARLSDRTAFNRTDTIKFVAEKYISSSWTPVKTYCDGALLASTQYTLANDGVNPNDSFSLTVKPLLQQRLEKTPDQTVVLYDPNKTTVDDTQIEVIPNIDGTEGTPTVTPIASMTMADVLNWFAETIGCAGYKTNINVEAWTISRIDFQAAQPYWNAIASEIGNHEPKLYIDGDNYLVLRDGTNLDYLSARTMTVSDFQNVDINAEIERFKGCVLTRQYDSTAWDYYELRQEISQNFYGGVNGTYPMTQTVTWYQDFYKNGVAVPVMTQPFSVRQLEYASASALISATAEQFSYRFGQGAIRMTRHDAKEWGIVKAPQSWITYQAAIPGPNVEWGGAFTGAEDSYTSASDNTFTEAFVLTKASRTEFSYFPMQGQSDSSFAGQRDEAVKALITIDSENPQLEEDFEQPLTRAQENGNLAAGQGSRWGIVERRKEAQEASRRKRQVNLRTRRHSALNSTSGMIAESYHDRRVGDIGESDIQTESKPIYITEGADSTATLYRSVNGGSAPLEVLQPLCIRLNKKQDYPNGIQATLAYYDETIQIGAVIDAEVDGRSTSIGIFEITSYTDTFNNIEEGGISTQVNGRQVG